MNAQVCLAKMKVSTIHVGNHWLGDFFPLKGYSEI